MWVSIGVGLLYALFIRTDLELAVSPVRNPTYVLQSDGAVRNIYDIRLRNKTGDARILHLSLTSDEILRIDLEGRDGLRQLEIPADTTILQRVYVTARPNDAAASLHITDLTFWVEDLDANVRANQATTFNGRE